MLSTFLAGEIVGHLAGLGGQAAPGGCLWVIELLFCGAALLFHSGPSLVVLEAIVNGRAEKTEKTTQLPNNQPLNVRVKGQSCCSKKTNPGPRGISMPSPMVRPASAAR